MVSTAVAPACGQPPRHLDVAEAHAVMQQHLRCQTDRCASRRQARDLLVTKGLYVLDDGHRATPQTHAEQADAPAE